MAKRETRGVRVHNCLERLRARGYDLTLEFAYERPRIFTKGGSVEVSPRLSLPEMEMWLSGFEAAANMLDDRRPK